MKQAKGQKTNWGVVIQLIQNKKHFIIIDVINLCYIQPTSKYELVQPFMRKWRKTASGCLNLHNQLVKCAEPFRSPVTAEETS